MSSNYNFPPGFASGFDPIQRALAMITADKDLDCEYSDLERDLIEALATRSSAESKAAADPAEMIFGDSCWLDVFLFFCSSLLLPNWSSNPWAHMLDDDLL